jgi:hypothetical protein
MQRAGPHAGGDSGMNWISPVQQLGRKVQGPICANESCAASAWERWRSRHCGVMFNDHWYCGEICLTVAIQSTLAKVSRMPARRGRSSYRLPLGLLILSRGIIGQEDLAAALQLQSQSPGMRIGECLCELGFVNEEQVTRALAVQNSIPVLLGHQPQMEYLVPLRLQEVAQASCFRVANGSTVYVGFSAHVDQSLVRAIASILGGSVEPCILPARIVNERLRWLTESGTTKEIAFETQMLFSEIAGSICSYAKQVGAEFIRVAPTSRYVWARLRGTTEHDLVFHSGCSD